MKFKTYKDNFGNKGILVYRRIVKESHHLGNIIRANPKIFGNNALFFYACGNEKMIAPEELRDIADKIDKEKIS